MPNTKSAERRMRNSARKHLRNKGVKSRLRTLEKKFLAATAAGRKEDAAATYRVVCSALDKAARGGAIPKPTANRKKSRLALSLKVEAKAK